MFKLVRYATTDKAVAGRLLDPSGEELCATLEPSYDNREHPCIPLGVFGLQLRTWGEKHEQYQKTFPPGENAPLVHEGMIEIIVPRRSAILFHMGNYYWQSLGCVLCGSRAVESIPNGSWFIPGGESRPGYVKAYRALLAELKRPDGDPRLDVREEVKQPLVA